jgi:hypothetical protein
MALIRAGIAHRAREGARMRYGLVVLLICLGIAFDLSVYIATSDDAFDAFDPLHPATLLPILANRYRELHSQGRGWLRNLVDEFTAPFRERLRHEKPKESLVP